MFWQGQRSNAGFFGRRVGGGGDMSYFASTKDISRLGRGGGVEVQGTLCFRFTAMQFPAS